MGLSIYYFIYFSAIEEMFLKQKITPAMQRIKELQINSLLTALHDAMQDYLKCLVDHREKCLELLKDMVEGMCNN